MENNQNDSGQRLLDSGERLIAEEKWTEAAAVLTQARQHASARLTAHNLIERYQLPGAFGEWVGVRCEISPNDDIYRFFDGHPTSVNPLRDYLADGWRTLSELMLLLESVDRPLLRMANVLEFASGHGRFTRHLVKALSSERVMVSDVVRDAVDFSVGAFGVAGVVSTAQPEDLRLPDRYDMVFVLSLFSHLPRSSWARWLRRLHDAVAPGGLLVFSTHGTAAAARQNVVLDQEGYFFAASSESTAIDAAEYGTAFTSEGFVHARLQECVPQAKPLRFAPEWFWHHQDAWVIQV